MRRVTVFVLLLLGASASAYLLPGGAILRRMAEGRNDLQLSALKVEGALLFSGAAASEASAALGVPLDRKELSSDAILYLKPPGRCRLEASAPLGNKIAVVQAQGRKRVEGTELPVLSVALEQLCVLFGTRAATDLEGRAVVEKHLRALGIEPRTTSLSRLGKEVAYVLGDPAEGKPQFWVYKENFRPARLRFSDPNGSAWDLRFIDYQASPAGEGLPRNVEVWRGNERLLKLSAFKGDSRTALPESLFSR